MNNGGTFCETGNFESVNFQISKLHVPFELTTYFWLCVIKNIYIVFGVINSYYK